MRVRFGCGYPDLHMRAPFLQDEILCICWCSLFIQGCVLLKLVFICLNLCVYNRTLTHHYTLKYIFVFFANNFCIITFISDTSSLIIFANLCLTLSILFLDVLSITNTFARPIHLDRSAVCRCSLRLSVSRLIESCAPAVTALQLSYVTGQHLTFACKH